ncbi:MAG: FecR family protein [Bacteroidales bacterium]|nr:FecR family protein [Bacteroidales bacterium]
MLPNQQKPFIAETHQAEVKVTGTTFTVKSKGEASIVLVESGTVLFYKKEHEDKHVSLTNGETGLLDAKEMAPLKKQNDNANYLAWKTNELSFDDEPLFKVIMQLENTFGATILYKNQDIKDCPITASFKQQPLDKILQVVTEILDAKVEKIKKYTLSLVAHANKTVILY